MTKGYVYILTNEAMPGLVKIGKTTRSVDQRVLELQSTGVPLPFKVYECILSPNCHQLEAEVHSLMPDLRVSNSREFFRCDPATAFEIAKDVHIEMLGDWVSEFAPECSLVDQEYFIDPSTIAWCANLCGLQCQDMDWVFRNLTADELSGVTQRRVDWVQNRRNRMAAGQSPDEPFFPLRAVE